MKIKQFIPLAIGALIVGILMELLLQIPEFFKGHEYTIKEFLTGSIWHRSLSGRNIPSVVHKALQQEKCRKRTTINPTK